MKYLITLIYILLFALSASSLYCFQNTEMSFSNKVYSLLETVKELRYIDGNKATKLARQAYNMSKQHNLKNEIAKSAYELGIQYCLVSNYAKAETLFTEAMNINKELGNDKEIAVLHNAFGQLYRMTSKYSKALQHLNTACRIKKENKDRASLAISYNNLALTYEELSDYPKALEYAQRANIISKRELDTTEVINSGITIANNYYKLDKYSKALKQYQALEAWLPNENKTRQGIIQNNIANIYSESKDYIKAEKYYNQCLDIYRETGNKELEASTLLNLGINRIKQRDYKKAQSYLTSSKEIALMMNDSIALADVYMAQGKIFFETRKYNQAITLFEQCNGIYCTNNVSHSQLNALENLYDLYALQNNYNKAFDYLKQYTGLKEEIEQYNRQNIEDAIITKVQAEADLEIANKNLEMKDKEYKALVRTIIIGIVFLIGIALILFFFMKTKKQLTFSKYQLQKKSNVQDSVYKIMTEDIRTILFDISVDIAKMEDEDKHKIFSSSFSKLTNKYNSMISEMSPGQN